MKITLLTGKTSKIEEEVFKQTGIKIKVIKRPKAKKLSLRIDGKTKMPTLSLPTLYPKKIAINFILEHQDWIKNKLFEIPDSKEFKDGETISIFGKDFLIKHSPSKKSGVYISENLLIVSGQEDHLHRRIIDFIKKKAKTEFLNKSNENAKKIDCKVNNVFIKDTKSRWGSCSSLGNINYSWRIALAPYFVFEYMVAHEVSHLKHQDHSINFWKCVESLDSEYKKGQNWLKKHGKNLYKYK